MPIYLSMSQKHWAETEQFLPKIAEAVIQLLQDGPSAVTHKGVACKSGIPEKWIRNHFRKGNQDLIDLGVSHGVQVVLQGLKGVQGGAAKGSDKITQLVAALVPTGMGGLTDPSHMQYLWVMKLAGYKPENERAIITAIQKTLADDCPGYHEWLGVGIFSLVRWCVEPEFVNLSRTEAHNKIFGMTLGVFRQDNWEMDHPDEWRQLTQKLAGMNNLGL